MIFTAIFLKNQLTAILFTRVGPRRLFSGSGATESDKNVPILSYCYLWILTFSFKNPALTILIWSSESQLLNCHFNFQGTDWSELARKNIPAPFVPKISNELDVSNFSEEFTKMTPTDSPAIVPPNYDKIFKGYSYVAPSVLFSENVVSEDIFRIADRRPSLANLIAEKFKVCIFNKSSASFGLILWDPKLFKITISFFSKPLNATLHFI